MVKPKIDFLILSYRACLRKNLETYKLQKLQNCNYCKIVMITVFST